jgi:hypothetical protein
MRPVLRPGLRLHRDASGRAALVERGAVYRLDDVTAALLSALDGLVDDATLLRAHPGEESVAAWAQVVGAGVVVDVEAAARLVRDLAEPARGYALREATALVAHDPAGAERCWRLRRRATVAVDGQGAVTDALATMLEHAGVGVVAPGGSSAHADLSVLTHDHEPATDAAEGLMREGRPHLVAGMRGTEGVVGPFVRPGTTPCLRCVDLARCSADPAWGAVRDQMSTPDAGTRLTAAPASGVVVAAVAALAAADVLAQVAGRAPVALGATLSMSLHNPLPVVRSWPMQPFCGCAWHAEVAARGQWTP